MCTVTIVPLTRVDGRGDRGDFRLACNRDELRTRPRALPPVAREFDGRRALLPRDVPSDGTWIAVNDVGLALTLLNYHPPPERQVQPPRSARRSRGLIIPNLVCFDSVAQVIAAVGELERTDTLPFRLVAVDAHEHAEFISNGPALDVRRAPRSRTDVLFFTSSGLGDRVVDAPRRRLFQERLQQGRFQTPDEQDAFHRHSWPERTPVSVCMRRVEACTVSYTVVGVSDAEVRLSYHAGPPDEPAETFELALPRVRGA